MANVFTRTKSIDRLMADSGAGGESGLKRTLGAWSLIGLGIGAIIGAGVVNGAKSFFTQVLPEYWLYVLGLLFILVTLFMPLGIVGLTIAAAGFAVVPGSLHAAGAAQEARARYAEREPRPGLSRARHGGPPRPR